MRSNFVPHTYLAGEGRCRVCDLPYSKFIDKEVADHRRYHRLYLKACDTIGAPTPEHERARRRIAGLEVLRTATTLKEKVRGAEMWFDAQYNDHVFGALYFEGSRLTRGEYFMRLDARGSIKGSMDDDVAAVLREKYSDAPML
jgi:hypothetical protein